MDLGAPELLVILVILLLITGPSKLVGLGSGLGKSIREFRSALKPDDETPVATESTSAPAQPAQITSGSNMPADNTAATATAKS